MGIDAKEKIGETIRSKYGKIDDDTLKRYFLDDFYISSSGYHMTEEMYGSFKPELDKILENQSIGYEELEFLGAGQTFSGIAAGNLVLKIGNKQAPVYNLPYRLNPLYQTGLADNVGLFVSQKADMSKISGKDVQNMYNYIRDTGGLWLDVKDENLGRVDSLISPEEAGLGGVRNSGSFDIDIPPYLGNVFLVDYEDVVYLTPEIRKQILAYEPVNINSIKREVVRDNDSVDEMYYQGYIIHSDKLLGYEERYQLQKGDFSKAERCRKQIKEHEKQNAQREYEIEQIYRHGRRRGSVGNKYSVKEIGIRAMQSTTLTRIKEMAKSVKSRIQNRRRTNVEKDESVMQVEEIDVSSLDIGFIDEKKSDYDPYTTR